MYLKLAWRNIWRNKRRTLITMASVCFAVVLAVIMRSTINGVFEKMINDIVCMSSGYIQIHKRGYWNERSVENTLEENKELIRRINEEKNIISWSPRLESFALASTGNRTRGAMVTGIYPDHENRITHLKEKLISGEFIHDTDKCILIPDGLAKYLRIKIKDTLVLIGQGYHGTIAAAKFPVKGIVKIGSPELNKSMCWLPMFACRNFLGTGNRLSSISILLTKENKMNEVQSQLKNRMNKQDYEVMTWKEMLPDLDQFIEADSSAHIITINILYLIIGFGIFGTLLMMMNERMHEFGILTAIGMKKRILSYIVFLEITTIAGMGTMVGIVGAIPVVLYLHFFPIKFTGDLAKAYEKYGMEPVIPSSLDLENFSSQAMIVFIITLLVSIYLFYKINKLKVLKAITS